MPEMLYDLLGLFLGSFMMGFFVALLIAEYKKHRRKN